VKYKYPANLHNPTLLSRFLKLFFRLLYHQFAWAYDLVAWIVSAGEWQNWVFTVLDDLRIGRVLELGFGPGHLQAALYNRGFSPVGIDASGQMAGVAHKRLVDFGFVPLLINGYAQSLPFRESCFDHLVATFPTDYILDPLTLSEAYRVLAPGGTFNVLPLARPTGNSVVSTVLSWLFHITGQASDRAPESVQDELRSAYLEPISQAGFTCDLSYRKVDSGELWVIVATKPITEQ
jgi:ubiquinone/menaquinone biosynthesis C-methylase UbiE